MIFIIHDNYSLCNNAISFYVSESSTVIELQTFFNKYSAVQVYSSDKHLLAVLLHIKKQ